MFREFNEASAGTGAGAIIGVLLVVGLDIESQILGGAIIAFCALGGFLKEIMGDPPPKRSKRKRR